ncbi:hypothetical protein RhiirA4_412592 [Rhizophagus irregularis]|uniref:F-box domain-containing protein n=1 Tax=Rhizophagus irregularis TaxID=588596 RepID=A0A2I1HM88_9GLOM|nr:hypothetical protein RhiirA4_412592 [Rhizophagus irregularis]
MLLIQVPREIHLSIIETGGLSINELKSLSFTCRHFAHLCLAEIWKSRKFIENFSLTKFRETLSNNPFMPYGDFILKIKVDELDKTPQISIDAELIKFFAQKSCLLPFELLGDRLVNLSMVAYHHLDDYDDFDAQDEQEEGVKNGETKITELSSLVNGGQQIIKQMYNYYYKPKVEFHDALSETIKLGNVKSIRLYCPKMTEKVWECFTRSAADSLQAIRITLNSSTMVRDPSTIVSLFGKYCKNLRTFDIDTYNIQISKESALLMLENCKKLETLDISASSKIAPFLYKSQSINSLYLSYPQEGQDLNQIKEMMENLTLLSFLKIDGKCNLSFLKNFPNLDYLQIGDFANMDDEGFLNISKTKITELILVKTPKISDEALSMMSLMPTLIKFNIRDRLPNVTQRGWINLAKRPVGNPSWQVITIDDGRQINPEFFKILDHSHHNLETLRIRGFSYDNLLKDDSFDNLKFKEAWVYYKKHSQNPIIHWPIKYNAKRPSNVREAYDGYEGSY